MANEDHLAILKQGVDVWNRWRELNPLVQIDLSEAHLANLDLGPAVYSQKDEFEGEASPYPVNFRKACLRGSNLGGCNLLGAEFNGADLSGADIAETVLREADFSSANLRDARFDMADLRDTSLVDADLTGAFFIDTLLINVDLNGAKGLAKCQHNGPSILDLQTLAKSQNLPLEFLRGVGLPDSLINNLRSVFGQPIGFYSCFISYSSKDQEFAERLHADLQDKGVRCWFAPEDMKVGDRFRTMIDISIRIHDKLLLILSENSIASDWVEKEVETAFEKERDRKTTVLFPIRLDNAVMDSKLGWAADIKRSMHIGDFRKWKDHNAYQGSFDRLLRDLKVEEKKFDAAE
jgi:hypothetical protein